MKMYCSQCFLTVHSSLTFCPQCHRVLEEKSENDIYECFLELEKDLEKHGKGVDRKVVVPTETLRGYILSVSVPGRLDCVYVIPRGGEWIRIGKAKGNNIIIDVSGVAQKQAIMIMKGSTVWGMFLGHGQVIEHTMRDSETKSIGNVSITFYGAGIVEDLLDKNFDFDEEEQTFKLCELENFKYKNVEEK
jgi:hypothetical protein